MGIPHDRPGNHRGRPRARVRLSDPRPVLTLTDYAVFKDKAYRVLVFDRAAFDAAPKGPKGMPLFTFNCETRAHQEDLAGALMLLRKALLPAWEV